MQSISLNQSIFTSSFTKFTEISAKLSSVTTSAFLQQLFIKNILHHCIHISKSFLPFLTPLHIYKSKSNPSLSSKLGHNPSTGCISRHAFSLPLHPPPLRTTPSNPAAVALRLIHSSPPIHPFTPSRFFHQSALHPGSASAICTRALGLFPFTSRS